ncbi:DUF2478 domain-containing protein [Pseudomonas sp.]|uniref:DUF2478 domain-containing protein n=1 Tax=Pseudomonas sp. TaxID=306 RepID=UPI003D0BA3CB
MNDMPFAAVLHAGGGEGDALLLGLARTLKRRGWQVRGLISVRGKDPSGRLPMQIADLRDGRIFDISQALGPGSHACSLDPGGLTQASAVLREALSERPDLVLVNRFGVQEASGRGFAQEMLALMSEGIPLLTLVSPQYLADWQRFTGRPDCLLPLRESALLAWAYNLPGQTPTRLPTATDDRIREG